MDISITQYGISPNTNSDATPAVYHALKELKNKAGKKRLTFPEGTYHFHSNSLAERYCYISNNESGLKKICFDLRNFQDLEIVGENASFIFHGRVNPFVLDNCQQVSLSGIRIDFARSFISRAVVIGSGKHTMDLQFPIDEDYFFEGEEIHFINDKFKGSRYFYNFLEFDTDKMAPKPYANDRYIKPLAKALEPGKVRFNEVPDPPAPGETIIMKHECRHNPAVFINESANIAITDFRIYHSSGMGVVAQNSSDITLREVQVTLPPNSNRLVSASDDATHFANCYGEIVLENCLFENQWDDGSNIHGVYRRIRKRDVGARNFIYLEAGHYQQMGIEICAPGDLMEFVDNATMLTYHQARVKKVMPLNRQITQVEFDEMLPDAVKDGDCIANLDRTPNLTVKNCIFRNNKPRGLLVTTPGNVLIEENTFQTPGAAIYISGDANFWFESGAVKDVTIRNNIFDNCNYMAKATGQAVIDIAPEIPKPAPDAQYHENIKIENNKFTLGTLPLVQANSVKGLTFKENHLTDNIKHQSDKLIKHVNCKAMNIGLDH